MKNILLVVLAFIMTSSIITLKASGQVSSVEPSTKQHKIVFQLTTDDTLAHRSLMKQLNNITTVAPDTKIEVVCHGPGLNMLVINKTIVQDKILQMKNKGIVFVACEFSMSERKITKENIIPEADYVKAGIIEIVSKQEQGWSYIKSGF